MRNGRPRDQLELTVAEAAQLQLFARSRSFPDSLCEHARIDLASAEAGSNTAICDSLEAQQGEGGKIAREYADKTHCRAL